MSNFEDITDFTVLDEDNNEVPCDVVMTFTNEEEGKEYIAYTDGTEDEDGTPVLTVSRCTYIDDNLELFDIEEGEEMDFVSAVLDQAMDD